MVKSIAPRLPVVNSLDAKVQAKFREYDSMPTNDQLRKLEQILHVYAGGDAHLVEGYKLTYGALVGAWKAMRSLDKVQQTLPLFKRTEVEEIFRKIFEEITEITTLIFPNDEAMANEMVKEEYSCKTQ